jgi:3',5'-cyclic-AMP phosphodiesterase
LRILHLSDTHLLAHGAPHRGSVDTTGLLAEVVDGAAALPRNDLVIVSGDITDDGSVEAYEEARLQVERLTEAWSCPSVWVMGNHDRRAGFREVLGDGVLSDSLAETGRPGGTRVPLSEPEPAQIDVAGLRVVALDTSAPQRGFGRVGAEQLAWLADVLADPAPCGTLLVLHHAPLTPQPSVLHGALRLVDASALADTIAGTDVRVVLGGHVHEPLVSEAGGVPVIAAPAVANVAETSIPIEEAAVRGTGWLSIELPHDPPPSLQAAEGTIRVHEHRLARPDDGEEIFRFTAEQVRQIGEAAGYPGWVPASPLEWSDGRISAGSDQVEWVHAPTHG